ncbi:MAG: hypothetical protein FWD73_01135 [Polyangiaceae bacterium]|nr:hypothetical protein [Polyangiaceae bacterium]
MLNKLAVLAALCGVLVPSGACTPSAVPVVPSSSAPTEIQTLSAGTTVSATTADQGDVARLKENMKQWFAVKPGPQMLLFARTVPGFEHTGDDGDPKIGSIVRVANPDAWPDDTSESYVVILDEKKRVRFVEISPTSLSGDWNVSWTTVFDEQGRTVAYADHYGGFNAMCEGMQDPPGLVLANSMDFFDAKGRRLAREYRLEDKDGKRLKLDGCGFASPGSGSPKYIILDVGTLLRDNRLLDAVTAAGGVVATVPSAPSKTQQVFDWHLLPGHDLMLRTRDASME